MGKSQLWGNIVSHFSCRVDCSEVYADDSKCIPTDSGDGRCYQTACVKDEMVLKINVRGEWLTCESDFQKLDVRVGSGALPQTLVCPRLSTACPDLFCPFTCAGRGTCNYANTVNGTIQPKCECFDSLDTSPGCSDSMLPDGGFLENSDGLFNNLEQDFFDPLVSVFVDHPDKWSTSSWAWAAGLITVFLIMLLCICSAFWPSSSKKKDIDIGRVSSRASALEPSTRTSSRQSSRAPHSLSPLARRTYHRDSSADNDDGQHSTVSPADLHSFSPGSPGGSEQQSNPIPYNQESPEGSSSSGEQHNDHIPVPRRSYNRSSTEGSNKNGVRRNPFYDDDDVHKSEAARTYSSGRMPVIEPTGY